MPVPLQFCIAILARWILASAYKVCGISLISAGFLDIYFW